MRTDTSDKTRVHNYRVTLPCRESSKFYQVDLGQGCSRVLTILRLFVFYRQDAPLYLSQDSFYRLFYIGKDSR